MFQDFNSYNQYYGINGAFNNQGLNANNLSNGFDFRTMNSNVNNEEIITLAQGVDLIRQSVSDEREDEMFYDSLIKKARTEQEKKIITEIRDDERKHNRILREVYFNLTGQMVSGMGMSDMPSMQMMPNASNMSSSLEKPHETHEELEYKVGLEKALFGELEAVIRYRRIMSVMPSGNNYILLMSIMTDEIRHSAMYNFLIHIAK